MRGQVPTFAFMAYLAVPGLALAQAPVSDPWEPLNRDLFAVHESIDNAVIEPFARGYRAATPGPVRQGVRNFLRNLRGPVIFANDLLQAEFARAGVTAARFGLNTTIGIAGVFDPAASAGLEYHHEDFGQTLAVWGVPAGPYLFVPIFGPSNVRDTAGRLVDLALDPLNYANGEDADAARIARGALTGLSVREHLLETVDDVRANSVDPYASFRTSYGLLRASAIENGRGGVQDLPDFEDIPETEDTSPGGGEAVSYAPSAPDEIGLTYFALDYFEGEAQ
ncbi:MAG: VacJ family lipoprotein [Hyphomonadaceae bacterium]|nr:VacJ family lipoprotein [Hyphomonadaceae bacterium]